MRVVLDSNILLSPHGAPHCIFQLWRAKRFELVTCPTQLDEIHRASHYPKLRDMFQPHRVSAMVNVLGAYAIPDPPLRS